MNEETRKFLWAFQHRLVDDSYGDRDPVRKIADLLKEQLRGSDIEEPKVNDQCDCWNCIYKRGVPNG